mmetsp:Transcript_37541/g.77033  ORF Transcript_37541/g.77033 Transcript_37541/m.77033 type:complete len:247 (+) Transcript_37541:368-1108(+)|eukprot:CAMPEP_0181319254 /NCGR_PEP_ID=MMETSP1101-20121128/17469_1 /TAXON_ID=46948 /ORGANISM="Rhodomonas abbreviata, Strain Caron Lab Isolate" /LENGTH=246 /DNA_ID=CAMNT_0023426833 /DNA_START=268 /DNA_END=1008 /DNA_ORIENTATION=-
MSHVSCSRVIFFLIAGVFLEGARGAIWRTGSFIQLPPTFDKGGGSLRDVTKVQQLEITRQKALSILRGGEKRLPGVVQGNLENSRNRPDEGEWVFVSAKNDQDDQLTVIFHTVSGVSVEIDHEYSDGGVSFCTQRGGAVRVYTAVNEVEESAHGFGAPHVVCALSSGDLRAASSLRQLGDTLGDWRHDGAGAFSNTYFGSKFRLSRSGAFLFLSNTLAAKAFIVDEGDLHWLDLAEGAELWSSLRL